MHRGNLKCVKKNSIVFPLILHQSFLHPLFSPISTLFFYMLPSSFLYSCLNPKPTIHSPTTPGQMHYEKFRILVFLLRKIYKSLSTWKQHSMLIVCFTCPDLSHWWHHNFCRFIIKEYIMHHPHMKEVDIIGIESRYLYWRLSKPSQCQVRKL